MSRLFVAAYPCGDAAEQLAALERPSDPGVRWVPVDQLHVTLRFLGPADAEAVSAALSAASLPAASARSSGPVGRLGRDALVVPIDGLAELAAAVRRATAGLGEADEHRSFVGHLTLARLKQRAACGLLASRLELAWPVTEIALVESVLHPDGARHRVRSTHRLLS